MTFEILLQIVLFGIGLSADAFSVAVALSLNVSDLTRKRMIFIAATFGICQALFPLTAYWVLEALTVLVGSSAEAQAGAIMATAVTWLSFGLLLFIGGKMLFEAIISLRKNEEEKTLKTFSVREVLLLGVATAIDAMASGVAFHNQDASGVSLSTNSTIWLHVTIIMVITFGLSLIGVIFGHFFERLLKGKVEISGIIGGAILILLAVYIVLSHYFIS